MTIDGSLVIIIMKESVKYIYMNKNKGKNKLTNYLKEVRQEIKKVSWPTKKEAFNYTMIVLGISITIATILGTFDYVLINLLKNIY